MAESFLWKGRLGPMGLHISDTTFTPSTLSALLAGEMRIEEGDVVIDVGCGSGILAIIAAKLGARHVHAVDKNPDVVEVGGANAAANGVAGRITFYQGDLFEPLDEKVSADVIIGGRVRHPRRFSRRKRLVPHPGRRRTAGKRTSHPHADRGPAPPGRGRADVSAHRIHPGRRVHPGSRPAHVFQSAQTGGTHHPAPRRFGGQPGDGRPVGDGHRPAGHPRLPQFVGSPGVGGFRGRAARRRFSRLRAVGLRSQGTMGGEWFFR